MQACRELSFCSALTVTQRLTAEPRRRWPCSRGGVPRGATQSHPHPLRLWPWGGLGSWGARVLLALGGCSGGNLRGEGETACVLSPKSLPKGLLAEGQVWNAQQLVLVLGPQSPGGSAVVSPLGLSPSGPLA